MLRAPRERALDDLVERRLRVDGPRIDVEHGRRAREAALAGGVPLLLADEVEQVGGIAGVEHAEAGGQAERGGVQANEQVRDRVKGAAEHGSGVGSGALREHARAGNHFASGASGEREQEDALRAHPAREQPRDARAQGGRLAGAGAGEDQEALAVVRRRIALLGVELLEHVGCVGEHPFAR